MEPMASAPKNGRVIRLHFGSRGCGKSSRRATYDRELSVFYDSYGYPIKDAVGWSEYEAPKRNRRTD